jgi:hypothetical protein
MDYTMPMRRLSLFSRRILAGWSPKPGYRTPVVPLLRSPVEPASITGQEGSAAHVGAHLLGC